MSTYTQLLYQIVFSTRGREKTMSILGQQDLYKYISGILAKKECHLYRIGGVEDHLHIVTHIPPTICISDLVKDIKLASSSYIKTSSIFLNFRGWQSGYGAFTYAFSAKDNLIEYVKRQVQHHKSETYIKEYKRILKEHGVDFEEEYLF